MKKTLYGIIAALLGGLLGAGGFYYYSLSTNPTVASASTGGQPSGPIGKTAEKKEPEKAAAPAAAGAAGSAPASTGTNANANATAGQRPAGAGGPGGPPGAGGPVAVEMTKVSTMALPRSVTAVGSLRSDESVVLRSEVAGRITGLFFQEGQRVAKGQKLVELDASLTRAELQQAQANQLLAKAKYERAVELQAKGFVSGQAKDEAENALKVAEAGTAVVQARLSRLTINAPMSGVAGLRLAAIGDYLKDGQDIVNIEKLDALKVDFKVPEIFATAVKNKQQLSITLDAIPKEQFKGMVYAINPQLDPNGRSVVVRASMKNNGKLNPGMFARVRLLLDDNAEALVVPEQSIVPQGDDTYIFRVLDGRVSRTKVDLGQRKEGKVEVLNGLSAGDTIVSAGWQKVRDGGAVRPAQAPGGSGSGGGGNPAGNAVADKQGDGKGEGKKAESTPANASPAGKSADNRQGEKK
ncbi:MAG: hypothetical protein RLZZ502_545 [Pseudomonadota bacterium]|jgi:membrane fusion protein (multidrug efflux system)